MSGEETLEQIRTRHPKTHVVIITAHGSIESAVEAMKAGAYDYVTKPFTPDQVRLRIRQIEEFESLRGEVRSHAPAHGRAALRRRVLDPEPGYARTFSTGARVAASDATMLVTGESGTGKSLLARLIHGASARRDGPFVTVDCGSFHETLLESELFGHRRGAFTGAVRTRSAR